MRIIIFGVTSILSIIVILMIYCLLILFLDSLFFIVIIIDPIQKQPRSKCLEHLILKTTKITNELDATDISSKIQIWLFLELRTEHLTPKKKKKQEKAE